MSSIFVWFPLSLSLIQHITFTLKLYDNNNGTLKKVVINAKLIRNNIIIVYYLKINYLHYNLPDIKVKRKIEIILLLSTRYFNFKYNQKSGNNNNKVFSIIYL